MRSTVDFKGKGMSFIESPGLIHSRHNASNCDKSFFSPRPRSGGWDLGFGDEGLGLVSALKGGLVCLDRGVCGQMPQTAWKRCEKCTNSNGPSIYCRDESGALPNSGASVLWTRSVRPGTVMLRCAPDAITRGPLWSAHTCR